MQLIPRKALTFLKVPRGRAEGRGRGGQAKAQFRRREDDVKRLSFLPGFFCEIPFGTFFFSCASSSSFRSQFPRLLPSSIPPCITFLGYFLFLFPFPLFIAKTKEEGGGENSCFPAVILEGGKPCTLLQRRWFYVVGQSKEKCNSSSSLLLRGPCKKAFFQALQLPTFSHK